MEGRQGVREGERGREEGGGRLKGGGHAQRYPCSVDNLKYFSKFFSFSITWKTSLENVR